MSTVNTSYFGPALTTFTVPPNVTSMRWQMLGATQALAFAMAGLSNPNIATVGYVAGTLSCSAGQQFTLVLGGYGGAGADVFGTSAAGGGGGYNGGGAGASAASSIQAIISGGNGGGGASDLRFGGTALSNRIMVAGGGGGTGGSAGGNSAGDGAYYAFGGTPSITSSPTSPTPPYKASPANYYVPSGTVDMNGAGGGPSGNTGGGAYIGSSMAGGTGGGGGTTSAAGAGGSVARSGVGAVAGSAGSSGSGGAGGTCGNSGSPADVSGGGGGGGGYFGGGGGSGNSTLTTDSTYGTYTGGGGGGGSNFLSGSWTSTVNVGPVYPPTVDPGITDGQVAYNGWAKVTYVQIPNAPSLSTPATGGSFDVNSALTFAWTYSSPDSSTSQGGFEVDYSLAGAGVWTAFSFPTSTAKQYSFAAATFTSGQSYDFRVRVYDNTGDVSPWTTVTISAITLPTVPTITAPTAGSPATATPFNLTWTIPSGTIELYRIQILATNGQTIVDSGEQNSTRRNLCTNPGFESNTTSWSTNSTTTMTSNTTIAKFGTHSMSVAWQNSVAQAMIYLMNTTPGVVYTASIWVAQHTASGTSPACQMAVANPGFAAYTFGTTTTAFTSDVFQQISVTFTAQQSTTNILVLATATTSQVTYFDGCLIEQGNLAANHKTYFDGGNTNGQTGTASWVGTANNSVSLLSISNVLSYSVAWPGNSQTATAYLTYSLTTSNGFYSNPGQSTFAVNINPPPAPTCSLAVDSVNARMTITIANGGGTYPAIYNDIYRQDITTGAAEIRIASRIPINTPYVDNTPAGSRVYQYRVRAYSSFGGYADAT